MAKTAQQRRDAAYARGFAAGYESAVQTAVSLFGRLGDERSARTVELMSDVRKALEPVIAAWKASP